MRIELRDRPDDEDEVKAARLDSGHSEDQAIERIKSTFDAAEESEPEPEPDARPRATGSPRARRSTVMPQPPNFNKMMKQVQQMQADMAKAQEQLKNEVVEASAGGGMVTVKVTGDLEVKEIRIDPAAVDPEDVELLQDMVLAATNEAIRSAQELANRKLGGLTGGMDLGGLGLPGL